MKSGLLMIIATVGTFILLYLLMFVNVPKDNAQILLAIVGPTLGFYFGSSVNKNQNTSAITPPTTPSTTDTTSITLSNTSTKEKQDEATDSDTVVPAGV